MLIVEYVYSVVCAKGLLHGYECMLRFDALKLKFG